MSTFVEEFLLIKVAVSKKVGRVEYYKIDIIVFDDTGEEAILTLVRIIMKPSMDHY